MPIPDQAEDMLFGRTRVYPTNYADDRSMGDALRGVNPAGGPPKIKAPPRGGASSRSAEGPPYIFFFLALARFLTIFFGV